VGSKPDFQQVAGSYPGRRALPSVTLGKLLCLQYVPIVTKQYNLVPANWRWCSAAGEVTAGLAESNGSLQPGLWLRSPAGWLPRTGITSGTLRLFRVWDYLYLSITDYSRNISP